MKLLDWMQHKFRQTNNDHLTTFAPRRSSACLTDDLQYTNPKSHSYAKPPGDNHFRKSFACMQTARPDSEQVEQDAHLFHGFLTIGTLAAFEPATFDTSFMGKQTQKDPELKQINDELEKVLITPQGKEDHGQVVCPLQGYLFSSVIETKEHRTSLGDLFQRAKMAEENTEPKNNNRGEKQKGKETLMKKILKGGKLYDKKPGKILQMFHKKVHPEGVGVQQKHVTRNQMMSELIPCAFQMNDSDGNREYWIKSDADYVVLEL